MPQLTLPDIPRLYTALAEWLACLVYILPLKKRVKGSLFYLALCGWLALLCGIQYVAGLLHPAFWVEMMLLAILGMLSFVFCLCNIKLTAAIYFMVRAFILAEFAASFEWQIYCFFSANGSRGGAVVSALFLVVIFAAVFVAMWFIERRHLPQNGTLLVGKKEMGSTLLIGLSVFIMSNISFVLPNTPFSSVNREAIFYIRTLVDFAGVVMLYSQLEQRREMDSRRELQALDDAFRRQYDQYCMARDNDDQIRRQYHDLKHKIEVIRAEADPAKRDEYLREMDLAIKKHEAENRTGNSVLDTILFGKALYCTEHDINLTCVADGTLLGFIETMDICTVFGNALDNAIESVEKLPDPEKRLITMSVSAQNDFVLIRLENYTEDNLVIGNELPATKKKDPLYHGYGLKSIKTVVEKYGGSFTIQAADHWFQLMILLPKQS